MGQFRKIYFSRITLYNWSKDLGLLLCHISNRLNSEALYYGFRRGPGVLGAFFSVFPNHVTKIMFKNLKEQTEIKKKPRYLRNGLAYIFLTTYCGVPDTPCLSKMSFILPDMLEMVVL